MKRKIKTVLVLISAISMAFLPCMTATPKADSSLTVLYNQEHLELPEDALITQNQVILVSVADLAEKLGAGFYYNNQDAYAIQYQGKIMFVKKDQSEIQVAPEQDPEQRETCEMQIPASFADGKLMISFEEFAKIFGMKWQYEEETQTVTLTDGEKEDVSQESEAEDTGSAQVNIYEQYRKLIVEYEERYGAIQETDRGDGQYILGGLCFMKLVDFDQNGSDELLLVYQDEVQNTFSGHYTFEVWGEEIASGSSSINMLDSGELYLTNGGIQTLTLTEYNNERYLLTGMVDDGAVNDYHGYAEGKFGIVREAKKQAGNGGLTYSINGNIVDEDQWKAEEEAWQASKITYRVNYGDYSNIIQTVQETKTTLDISSSSQPQEDQETDAAADYILPDSSQKKVTQEQLAGLTSEQLSRARNEIYARHGRRFKTPELQQYFDSKEWYVPQYSPEEFDKIEDSVLSEVEKYNLDQIKAVEKQKS